MYIIYLNLASWGVCIRGISLVLRNLGKFKCLNTMCIGFSVCDCILIKSNISSIDFHFRFVEVTAKHLGRFLQILNVNPSHTFQALYKARPNPESNPDAMGDDDTKNIKFD